jgi:multicomponent Na+:H+ antiporter subunit B
MIGLFGFLILGMNSFLDPTILPLGNYGKLLSAGAIPVIYSLIGLKVGSELTTIIDKMGGE